MPGQVAKQTYHPRVPDNANDRLQQRSGTGDTALAAQQHASNDAQFNVIHPDLAGAHLLQHRQRLIQQRGFTTFQIQRQPETRQ